MKIYIELTETMALDIAGYLHRKFRERVRQTPDDQPEYNRTQFAADIGIDYDAFNAIYNNRKGTQRMSLEILQKLIAYFGEEFTDEFGLTPKRKGQG